MDGYPHYTLGGTTTRRYAVTILEDGVVTAHHKKISRTRLLRLIHLHKPTYVAVDNVYELAAHLSGLRHFFSQLPAETQVVQVTGFPEDPGNLQQKATAQGLPRPPLTSPLDEAEACARLTTKGVGATVHVLEDETRIRICRTVSLGPGGSSQTRYRRRIHASILNLKKRVTDALHKRGVDYDLFTTTSDFGLDRAVFHVYASRARLHGVITPYRGKYVALKISPVYRNQIGLIPRTPPSDAVPPAKGASKQLILGIDPGTTCGVAILTLDATPLYLKGRKGLTRGEITRLALSYGRPLLVAADVTPAPAFVKKLAHMINAVLFVPAVNLDAAEKRELTRLYAEKHGVPLRNTHTRAALAAAIKAYQRYKNKFEQVEAEARRTGVTGSLDEVKALVVRGQPIQRALDVGTPSEPHDVISAPAGPSEKPSDPLDAEARIQSLHERVAFFKEQVRQLKESNEHLLHEARRRDEQIHTLTRALDATRRTEAREIKQSRTYQQLERELETLRQELAKERQATQRLETRLETLRHYRGLASKGDVVFLKPIDAFTKAGLDQAYRLYDITRGDVVLFLDASGGGASTAEELVKRGVKAVVSQTSMAHQAEAVFESLGVAVVPYDELTVAWVEGYPYVTTEDLETVLKKGRVEKKAELNAKLLGIVDDYKRERQQTSKRTPVL